ncbi:MAG TPA: hypothetical protein VKH44_13350 [Pirellulaceae bacterium]|nr:hypothetical protein [Pirellulaceae bacterium]
MHLAREEREVAPRFADEFQPITPVGNLNGDGIDNDFDGNMDEGDEFATVRAIAYGGRQDGVDAPDVMYIGKGLIWSDDRK